MARGRLKPPSVATATKPVTLNSARERSPRVNKRDVDAANECAYAPFRSQRAASRVIPAASSTTRGSVSLSPRACAMARITRLGSRPRLASHRGDSGSAPERTFVQFVQFVRFPTVAPPNARLAFTAAANRASWRQRQRGRSASASRCMSASPSASASCVSASASARAPAPPSRRPEAPTPSSPRRTQRPPGPARARPPGGGAEHQLAHDPSRRGDGAGEPQRAAPADRVRDAAGEERARRGAGEEQVVEARRARVCDAGVPRAFKRAFERLGAQKRRRGRARVAQREPHAERRRGDGEDRQRGPERARPPISGSEARSRPSPPRVSAGSPSERAPRGSCAVSSKMPYSASSSSVTVSSRERYPAESRGRPADVSARRALRVPSSRGARSGPKHPTAGAPPRLAPPRAPAKHPAAGGPSADPADIRPGVTSPPSGARGGADWIVCLGNFSRASKFFRSDQRTDAF